MVKKKKFDLGKEISEDIQEVGEEVKQIEKWVIERRKFFIKLAIVGGSIAILLILSNLYLRISGFG